MIGANCVERFAPDSYSGRKKGITFDNGGKRFISRRSALESDFAFRPGEVQTTQIERRT